jgi:hypothetical protein
MTWSARGVWVLAIRLTVCLMACLTATGAASAAETLWGLTANNTLVRFSSNAPGTTLVTLPITGLSGGEQIVAIEVEWVEGRLTGVSNAGRRYQINRTTGAATQLVPAEPVVALTGAAFGASDDGSFLLVVSASGSVVTINKVGGTQTPLPALAPPSRIVALAWRHPDQPQRVAIDSATDTLHAFQLEFGAPSLVSIGPLGLDTSDDAGLEFGPHDGVLYAALTVGGTPGLYIINPATGQATLVGAIAAPIISLTADMQGAPEITRNNPPPVDAFTVHESDTTLTFTVRRTGDDTVAADYVVTTPNWDIPPITPGDDFVPVAPALHFAVGELEKTVAVTIKDDTVREPLEQLRLTVTETAPGTFASATALIAIVDDDNLPPVLTMTFPSSSTLTVSSPTVTMSGLASDEDPAVIKLFRPDAGGYLTTTGLLATTTGSPWTFADVPLATGRNIFAVRVEDPHGLTDTRHFSVWRETAEDRTYVFAEGATGPFFTTDLLFANPHATDLGVIIDFLREDGTVISHPLNLPAQRRTTLTVNTVPGLEATAAATVVRAPGSYPIVVERTMRWDESGYGASTEKAASELSRTWYFAEGSQGVFFSTFLLLVNPQATPNDVTVRFLREGAGPITKTYPMLPRQRLTIDAGGEAELVDTSFGIEVSFTDPGMAERAMYFGRRALWDGGHESAGAPAPATGWLLAEGATGAFFETFVLVANPSSDAADVTMTYLPEGGTSVTRTHRVPANGRLTVNIEQEDASLANLGAVGTRLTSTVPVVVERSQYWPWSPAEWYEAHNSFGETAAATHWGLAEGRVGGGAAGYRTYILLTNPDPGATAHVTMTFLRQDGTPVIKAFSVPPASRLTIDVGSAQVPEIIDGAFGADILSDVPIAVERAMYSNANGQFWAAGTNAAATRLP